MGEKDMSKNDGGPAFPVWDDLHGEFVGTGMTLRDYFAGQALAGLASALYADARLALSISEGIKGGMIEARAAYALADAMLKSREP